jgi:putative hydrolase of the HAD superfamily
MKRVDGIRAVTYDCWGTLLQDRDWEGAMHKRIGALSRFMDLGIEEATSLLKEAWAKHEEAWKQVAAFGPGRMAAYCLESRGISDDESLQELTREFEEATLEYGVDPVEGAAETLQALEAAGIRRGLVCDTGMTPGRVVRQLLDAADLSGHLEVLCFSDEVGVQPPEAIHIGDLRRTDIAGAHDVGMHAARFRGVHDDRSDAPEAKIVLDRHIQLLDVLGLEDLAPA